MQSASRRILSYSRLLFRALPITAAVLTLASAGVAEPHAPVATTATLSSAASRDALGKTVLTAHVLPVPAAADDRGTVSFVETGSDGQTSSLGSAFVGPDGDASLTLSALTSGVHSVRAIYSGSDSAAASTSAPLDITAEANATPTFALAAAPTTLNLNAGQQGTVTIAITPSAGFANYVSLSCAGLPLFTTCNFLPSNVNATNGLAVGSTMTLNTTAPSGTSGLLRHDSGFVYCFLLPGVIGLIGLGFERNRGLRMLALLCVVGSLVGGASSCAQRYRYLNYGPSANPGTPAGKSIIRIYGTAVKGALSTSQCFQVTLNMTSSNTSGTAGNNLTPCS